MEPVVIETERLILRPLSEADIREFVPLIGDRRAAATTLRIPHPFHEQDALDFLSSAAKEDELRFGIRLRDNGASIGGMGLHPYPSTNGLNSATGLASRIEARTMRLRQLVRL